MSDYEPLCRKPFTSNCQWCNTKKDTCIEHRDFEEGCNGPVYDVCAECRSDEIERNIDEINEYIQHDEDFHS